MKLKNRSRPMSIHTTNIREVLVPVVDLVVAVVFYSLNLLKMGKCVIVLLILMYICL